MNNGSMTSLQRILTTLGHEEPDYVPILLPLTLHGAKELGLSIREYFSSAENVIEGQLRLRAKFEHDCVVGFFYAPSEVEAWGGEVVFYDDGPPNSGEPFIKNVEDIANLGPPRIAESPSLLEALRAIEGLKEAVGGQTLIIGVAIAPFSLPVMQMGFDKYLDLLYERPALWEQLMKVNEAFCVEWSNAQLEAGATSIVYFDPVSSPEMIPRDLYLRTGHQVAKRTLPQINGPTVTHFASARTLPIIEDVIATGTGVIGVSEQDDLTALKEASSGKITLLGNLNAIKMRHWSYEEAEAAVKDVIAKAGPGGGFALCDNHGEIPYQVPDEVLFHIMEAGRKWGRYPLDWVEGYEA